MKVKPEKDFQSNKHLAYRNELGPRLAPLAWDAIDWTYSSVTLRCGPGLGDPHNTHMQEGEFRKDLT